MDDPKQVPKETTVFDEELQVTGIIFNNPHLVASSDKGHILF